MWMKEKIARLMFGSYIDDVKHQVAEEAVMAFSDPVAQKAALGTSTYTTTDMALRPKVTISNTPADLMSLNIGWTAACLLKRSSYITTVPVHAYARMPSGASKSLHVAHKRIPQKNAQIICKAAGKPIAGQEIVELPDHPVLDLLSKPDPDFSWGQWISVLADYLAILGNAYFLIERKGGKVVGLRPLLSEWMYLDMDQMGRITKYRYFPAAQMTKAMEIDVKDILHLKNNAAGSLSFGRGLLENVIFEAALLRDMTQALISISANGGVPSCHVEITGQVGSQAKADDAAARFRAKYGGLKKGSPLISFADPKTGNSTKITPLTFAPVDMQYDRNFLEMRRIVCAGLGVPFDMLSSENSNRSTSTVAADTFMVHTILPTMSQILQELTKKLCPEWDDKLFLGYDQSEIMVVEADKQASVVSTYVSSGIMTITEARDTIGLEGEYDKDDLAESAKPKAAPVIRNDKANQEASTSEDGQEDS